MAGKCPWGVNSDAAKRDRSGHVVLCRRQEIHQLRGVFAYRDKLSLSLLCRQFAVSKSAAVIRLRHLGYIEDRPYREYIDPLEVWP